MVGLGYRRAMSDWNISDIKADFFEVSPENWVGRDLSPLQKLHESGRPIFFHGVSLNLGGTSPINHAFLSQVNELIETLDVPFYSDHLSASGDAHQLYDLFPIPFTRKESQRVADRIKSVQDFLGRQIGIENATWYTNVGEMREVDFLSETAELADCQILLDLNNIDVNQKNHQQMPLTEFLAHIDFSRVSYLHVAGHEYDERFSLYVDTHSQAVEPFIRQQALALQREFQCPILLEWDNDIPSQSRINQELQCLSSMPT